jgi:hypothetical protein
MTSWTFLVAPELHQYVKKKTAHRDQACKNDDGHEILSFGVPVDRSPHFVNHHSETVLRKS